MIRVKDYVEAVRQRFIASAGQADEQQAVGPRREETLFLVIRALTVALADAHPELKKHGRVVVGCDREATRSGIVGYLRENEYTDLSSTTLEDTLSKALKG